ncbi:probable tRNA N6-adenosine threonylcarbamoyltransferase, mitochondrial [Gastrolobium bilobum]|uniref:probable tRNA N6-adenosine threonylcarbamoyltransferase, mitochondrial n=1 Tax=Gastrolobium bilobum TaxID=150636 RepID=UPI002AAFA97E|nr:probable tRNA N6-adenosine threonylcarbamoyltransferase, mitochondrial [Gastrolobium bilobum]
MAVPSTFSRLNFFPKPSLFTALTNFRRNQLPPNWPFATVSSRTFSSIACSSSNRTPKRDGDLVVLGIETSCDDTAAAVVRSNGEILSQVVSSQGNLLAKYGGVAPKMAEEAHSQVIDQVVQEALDKASITEKDLTAVAVTIGPGLSLCLRVGVQKARRIAGGFSLPIISVHHMEAHALVARLNEKDLQFPFMALLISGGHNLLILAHDLGQYIQLGTTIDDAIGEAYDKTAKWLGLDMRRSGGPAIEELAREGNAQSVSFSIPMKQHKDCNFSYAGLKTQVRLAIESKKIDAKIPISSASNEDRLSRADIAASFQRIAVLHLEERCERAIQWALKMEPSIRYLVVSGGVASNQYVRARLDMVVKKNSLQLVCPPPQLCTDNGVMVAWTGIEHFRMGRYDPPPPAEEPEDFLYDLRPRWPLGEEYAEGKSEARSLRRARVHPSLTSLIQASLQQ